MEKFKEDPRVQEILEQVNLDVREYSQNVDKLLETAEKNSVNDYVKQQQSLSDLHEEILVHSFDIMMNIEILIFIYFIEL